MNILAIETTGAKASVAIIKNDEYIFEEKSTETLNHLQNLMFMVEKTLEKSQLQIGDVTAIAASQGPGSFTGIRIGVSSARALAQALNLKCISVPTLQSFLYNVPEYRGVFCPIFDARRSQVYGGAYKWKGDNNICEVVKGGAYTLDEYLELLKLATEKGEEEVTFFGDGVEVYKSKVEEWQNTSLNSDVQVSFANEDVRYQQASSIGKFAVRLYHEGAICDYSDLEPNYMRKAEAERKLEEAEAKEKGKG